VLYWCSAGVTGCVSLVVRRASDLIKRTASGGARACGSRAGCARERDDADVACDVLGERERRVWRVRVVIVVDDVGGGGGEKGFPLAIGC
jgi:hypothetical protein